MSVTIYAGIGIFLVLAIIGLVIWLRHDSFKSDPNKKMYIVVGVLQAISIILYLTGLLDRIAQMDAYLAFYISAVISVVCIVISVWMVLPTSKYQHGIKYLFLFIAIVQVISTILTFLVPEAGIPPLIQF